jgi:hypothetical protein
MHRSLALLLLGLTAVSPTLRAQSPDSMPAGHRHTPGMTHAQADSSTAAMKKRGKQAMMVDQDKATHHFDALPDGGRIELQSSIDDSVAISGIRAHFKEIETAFRAGDFSIPMFVHAGEVPGTSVMAAKRSGIRYIRRDLPRGAELRLRTTDPEVVRAIHSFMAFQRREHHATGIH